MNDKLKKCEKCQCEYDYEFHGKCPRCDSGVIDNKTSGVIDNKTSGVIDNKTFWNDKTQPGGLFLILSGLITLVLYSGMIDWMDVMNMKLFLIPNICLIISGIFFIKN